MTWAYVETVSEGGSWEDYQRVVKELDDGAPEGLIVHVAGPYAGGFRIIDVWESEDAYNRFRDEQLMPAFERGLGQERAAANPPDKETLDVQHMVKP